MAEVWVSTSTSHFNRYVIGDFKVRVIRDHHLKVPGFAAKSKDLEFPVIRKRKGGYDIDLSPLETGTEGFVYDTEVEEIPAYTVGDRVRIVRQPKGHRDFEVLVNAQGTVDLVEPIHPNIRTCGPRYQVSFDEPLGSRGWFNYFPLFHDQLAKS